MRRLFLPWHFHQGSQEGLRKGRSQGHLVLELPALLAPILLRLLHPATRGSDQRTWRFDCRLRRTLSGPAAEHGRGGGSWAVTGVRAPGEAAQGWWARDRLRYVLRPQGGAGTRAVWLRPPACSISSSMLLPSSLSLACRAPSKAQTRQQRQVEEELSAGRPPWQLSCAPPCLFACIPKRHGKQPGAQGT